VATLTAQPMLPYIALSSGCAKRGDVWTPPRRLLVHRGGSVCSTLAVRPGPSQPLARVCRDTLLHACSALLHDAEQPFNRNFFLDKTLWTTLFPDKMPSEGFIRNFFRYNNHCTWLVGGLSGIPGQTSTGCLQYSLGSRQSIVCSFFPAVEAEPLLNWQLCPDKKVILAFSGPFARHPRARFPVHRAVYTPGRPRPVNHHHGMESSSVAGSLQCLSCPIAHAHTDMGCTARLADVVM